MFRPGARDSYAHEISFDYAYLLYPTQLLEGKTLFYSGLQFDSYWKNRLHYSMNGIF